MGGNKLPISTCASLATGIIRRRGLLQKCAFLARLQYPGGERAVPRCQRRRALPTDHIPRMLTSTFSCALAESHLREITRLHLSSPFSTGPSDPRQASSRLFCF
ncbi:hypothetical protein BaRGS_00002912 [Batillaria attramentaria]|uniref:Uncharacterized protein n=1 Tax=Batillaria attramentaria TaxID=370345 RepID=A0ABD0M2B9_9CAEN